MAYEEAQQFLARVVPWPEQIDPPEFFVGIWLREMKDGKPMWWGRSCTTLAQAINFIGYAHQAQRGDIYVCMSAQAEGKPKVDRRGRTYWNAKKSKEKAVWLQGFYADIDVKKDAYPTTDAAIDAFGAFLKATGLPVPTFIVMSGSGGFQPHWTLWDRVAPEQWYPVAHALAGAMKYHGLIADYGCTIDPARILRVPNTSNFKHKPPKPVELGHTGNRCLLDDIARAVAPYAGYAPPRAASTPTRAVDLKVNIGPISQLVTGQKELVPNQQESLPSLLEVARVCPFVRHACTTGGRDYLQPLWWETAKIAFHTREGEAALHVMADQYPKYDVVENHELYERVVRERTPIDQYGWPKCDTIRLAGSPVCDSCSWFTSGQTKDRSPFNFLTSGAPPPAAAEVTTTVTPDIDGPKTYGVLPTGYEHDPDGKVMTEIVDDEGNTQKVRVCNLPVIDLACTTDPYLLNWQTQFDQRGWLPITLPFDACGDNYRMRAVLAAQGMLVQPEETKSLGRMLVSFVQQLRERKIDTEATAGLGWYVPNGVEEAFVFDGRRANGAGSKAITVRSNVIQNDYRSHGELKLWQQAAELVTDQKRQALDTILAVAFAAPLLQFTSNRGLIISSYSKATGIGKTTAMRVSQATWADPVHAMQTTEDTYLSVTKKLGIVKNLPLFWDELKHQSDVRDLGALIFNLTMGKTKQRLDRSSNLMTVETWKTLLATASNFSMLDVAQEANLTTAAGIVRVYETFVAPPNGVGQLSVSDADALSQLADHNYGHAGALFRDFLGANISDVRKDVVELMQVWANITKAMPEERFWVSAITTIMLGATYAKKLGLLNFDLDDLAQFHLNTFNRLRLYRSGTTSDIEKIDTLKEFISHYYNQNRRNKLETDLVATAGRPRIGGITIKNPVEANSAPKLTIQMARDDGLMRFSKRDFMDHLDKQRGRIDKNEVIRNMITVLHGREIQGRIGAGCGPYLSGTKETLLEFDLTTKLLDDLTA